MFDIWDMLQLTYQERLEQIRRMQFNANNLTNFLQSKVYEARQLVQVQPQNVFEQLRTRQELKGKLMREYSSY